MSTRRTFSNFVLRMTSCGWICVFLGNALPVIGIGQLPRGQESVLVVYVVAQAQRRLRSGRVYLSSMHKRLWEVTKTLIIEMALGFLSLDKVLEVVGV